MTIQLNNKKSNSFCNINFIFDFFLENLCLYYNL